ncbi:hypothetical protein ACFX2I_007565 [Malus domestica]
MYLKDNNLPYKKNKCKTHLPRPLPHSRQPKLPPSHPNPTLPQRSLDLDLDNLISQRSDLDKQFPTLCKSSQVPDIVKANSDYIISNVTSTCDIADNVSAKVNELDLTQSCVRSTLLHLDAIVE